MLLQPYDLYKEGWADAYVHGMVNQVKDKGEIYKVSIGIDRFFNCILLHEYQIRQVSCAQFPSPNTFIPFPFQVAQALDDSMSPEVQNHLFQEPGKKFGLDLAALNVQRGREHGIPSYNK